MRRKSFLIISMILLLFLIFTLAWAKMRLSQNQYQIPNGMIAPSGGGNFSNSTGYSLNATTGQCFIGRTNTDSGDVLVSGRYYPLEPKSYFAGAILY